MNVSSNIYYLPLDGAEADLSGMPNPRPNLQRAQSAVLPGSSTMPSATHLPIRRSETSYQENASACRAEWARDAWRVCRGYSPHKLRHSLLS